jgi:DNA adenine methylase
MKRAAFTKYPGAKWKIADWVVSHLPKRPVYIEPFAGSAAVYLNLPWVPKHAVLSDVDGEVVNLFRVMRDHGPELAAKIALTKRPTELTARTTLSELAER